MRQAIHIFRKDVRHCWPYIAGVAAATAAHAWQECRVVPQDLSGFLVLIMVVGWWLAISATVHGESTVGDRQFWVTRPYSWKSLLAAKLLFVVLFLAAPLFISDCVILRASGYSPLDMIDGLLMRQLWLLSFLILPFVLAALTQMTRDFVLTGLVVYLAAWSGLLAMSRLGTSAQVSGLQWLRDAALWPIAAAGFSLAVWQYARRRTALIRALAAAAGVLMMLATAWYTMGSNPVWPPPPLKDDPRLGNVALHLVPDSEASTVSYTEEVTGTRTVGASSTPAGSGTGTVGLVSVEFTGWPRDLIAWHPTGVAAATPRRASTDGIPALRIHLGKRTYSDGRESIELVYLEGPSATTVDLEVSLLAKFYDHPARVDLTPSSGWVHVSGCGSFRRIDDVHGVPLVFGRVAEVAGEWGLAYSLGNGNLEDVENGEWLPSTLPPLPVWFAFTPVDTFGELASPGTRTAVLTVKHLVGVRTYDNLRVAGVRLSRGQGK